jgi:hypothetical protein
MSDSAIAASIGYWFVSRFRNRLKEASKKTNKPHFVVAKQLRKMGVPLETALFILNR